jgi:hypothetical protein
VVRAPAVGLVLPQSDIRVGSVERGADVIVEGGHQSRGSKHEERKAQVAGHAGRASHFVEIPSLPGEVGYMSMIWSLVIDQQAEVTGEIDGRAESKG